MTYDLRFVAIVAVLIALVLSVPVEAQTKEQIPLLRAWAEEGIAEAQFNLVAIR